MIAGSQNPPPRPAQPTRRREPMTNSNDVDIIDGLFDRLEAGR